MGVNDRPPHPCHSLTLFARPNPPSALYRVMAYRFLAQAHWDKSEHGTAIGLLLQAQGLLKPRADGVSIGLPAIEESRFLSKYKG
jgi:hypothetical protein